MADGDGASADLTDAQRGERFTQPGDAMTVSDGDASTSPEALAVLKSEGVEAWEAWVAERADAPRLAEARQLEQRMAAPDLDVDDEPDPVITEIDQSAVLRPDEPVADLGGEHDRVDGRDGAQLHQYWTAGPGLARWSGSARPWRALRRFLSRYLSGKKLDATTSAWYRDVFGHLPGQD